MVEICREDWAEALAPAVTVAFGFKSRFYLSTSPIPETLQVEVDGAVVPAVQAAPPCGCTTSRRTP
ncbi:MAG: hypothetical protein H6730_14465 [Deltaproteobacteria bacterium]|nr:hypothetical protein [Deltaproteobacteria bacterium]